MSRFHQTEWDLLPERAFQRVGRRMTLEGGKGSSAPAPDPRLVDAQIRSMGIQDDAIQRVISNSESMMPLQREALQFGLDTSRVAYDQSQEDRQWFLGRRNELAGLQRKLVDQANAFNADERGAQLAGKAMGDVTQAFDVARGSGLRAMTRRGVDPTSGAYGALMARSGNEEALAKVMAASKVREAARQEGYGLLDRAVNSMSGYPAMASNLSGAGAGFGASGLTLANAGLGGMNSGFGMAGTLGGQMGQNATGMFNAQANYKLGADKNDGEMWGAVLGLGGKLGAAYLGGL